MRDDLKYWIALSMINGIGIVLARSLLREFGNVAEIFKASKKKLSQIERIGTKNADVISRFDN